VGYARAGFEVVGVDINPQPSYPFEFHQGDALAFPIEGFDVIHASPPCQAHSTLRHRTGHGYPDLIPQTRALLVASGLPYVIENVAGAPLVSPVMLCGSSFGLGVRRHRLFESSAAILGLPCDHRTQPEPIDVSGNGGYQHKPREKQTGGRGRKPRGLAEAQAAMDMPWSSRRGISQAIPPAYTEWIGRQLIASLEAVA
jgi:DNA (cytosine-5)-methyltransferase 1